MITFNDQIIAMTRSILLLVVLNCFIGLSSFSQRYDISGEWSGYLGSGNKAWVFSMKFVFQQTAQDISGTAKFVALDGSGAFGVFEMNGRLARNRFSLFDLGMIAENNVRNTWSWCKKIYSGTVKKTKDSLIIEGTFRNDGKRGFYRLKMLDSNNLYCGPGAFRLARPLHTAEQDSRAGSELPVKQITEQNAGQRPLPVTQNSVPPMKDPRLFLERMPKLQQVITTSSDSLKLSFYDNAEIDDDTISVYVNRKLLFKNRRITDKPFVVMIPVQPGVDNEILMHAENEGTIPPNTALLVVEDMSGKREILLRSSKTESGLIIARRVPVSKPGQ